MTPIQFIQNLGEGLVKECGRMREKNKGQYRERQRLLARFEQQLGKNR